MTLQDSLSITLAIVLIALAAAGLLRVFWPKQ